MKEYYIMKNKKSKNKQNCKYNKDYKINNILHHKLTKLVN